MLRNISSGPGLSAAQVEVATSNAIANANLGNAMYNAVVSAAPTIASEVMSVSGASQGVQRVADKFEGADTEIKVLYGFEGYFHRIYGVKITCAVQASDVTFCGGEVGACLPMGPTHRLAVGSELSDGRTEFVGVFDSAPDTSVVLRKSSGSTLIYEVDFEFIRVV